MFLVSSMLSNLMLSTSSVLTFDRINVTLHAKRYHLVLKIIFELIVPCYKHGNAGLIAEGFTHLQASVT